MASEAVVTELLGNDGDRISFTVADGGAIDCINSSAPIIKNNIIRNNFANHTGGGLHFGGESSGIVENNIIDNNI